MNFIKQYLNQSKELIDKIDKKEIFETINIISNVKKNSGRIFFIGSGGGAGHASHAGSGCVSRRGGRRRRLLSTLTTFDPGRATVTTFLCVSSRLTPLLRPLLLPLLLLLLLLLSFS